jgi:hypothetical protein
MKSEKKYNHAPLLRQVKENDPDDVMTLTRMQLCV